MSIVIIHKDKDSFIISSDTLMIDSMGRQSYCRHKFQIGINFVVGISGITSTIETLRQLSPLLSKDITFPELVKELKSGFESLGWTAEDKTTKHGNMPYYDFNVLIIADLKQLKLYEVYDNFGWYEVLSDYMCTGSGCDQATGVLTALDLLGSPLPVKKRVKLAIKTAKKLISSCGGKTYIRRIKQIK